MPASSPWSRISMAARRASESASISSILRQRPRRPGSQSTSSASRFRSAARFGRLSRATKSMRSAVPNMSGWLLNLSDLRTLLPPRKPVWRKPEPSAGLKTPTRWSADMKIPWAISVLSSFAIFAAQAPALADDEFADLAAKAKAEGEVTWYTAHFDTTLVGKIGSAFTAKYPGVKVNGLKATAQVSYQRLLQDLSAGAPQADVFSSTDASQFVELARKNALEAYRPQNVKKIIAAFQNFDAAGFSHVTAVSLVAITYNNQKISEADIPKTWQGLLDPKWSNNIALGDPHFGGAVGAGGGRVLIGAGSVTLQKMCGWVYFTRLSHGKPLITRAIDDPVTILNSGERILAAGD